MKKLSVFVLLNAIIGNLNALDLQSYQFIDLLLSLNKPTAPIVFEDALVFTSDGSWNRKVGVSFAHEKFAKVYWFKKILIPIDQTEPFNEKAKFEPERVKDSGLLFYAYEVPPGMREVEYRLVVDGLWCSDPANPQRRIDINSGLELSIAATPHRFAAPVEAADNTHLRVKYSAPSGDHVSLAGDFNGWDPFLYRLKETERGVYSIELPLPAGTYRYVLYHNGSRVLDPGNLEKVYAAGGSVVNTVTLD